MHTNSDLYKPHKSIINVQLYIYELKEELALQKQLAKLKQQACSDHTTSTSHQRPSSSPKRTFV